MLWLETSVGGHTSSNDYNIKVLNRLFHYVEVYLDMSRTPGQTAQLVCLEIAER